MAVAVHLEHMYNEGEVDGLSQDWCPVTGGVGKGHSNMRDRLEAFSKKEREDS